MRSQWPQSENANQLLKGQYICFLQRLTSFTTCLENKNTVYIDNHKTTRLAGQFNSLYISIFSQEVLNKIKKPSSEWRWPRHIRDKFQKVENMSKTKKSTSYTSFTKFTYNGIYSIYRFSGTFHDEKVSMHLFTKPQKISTGHRSLSVSL